jgi:hypothetical protein
MQELTAEGDRSSLYDIARALLGLQAMFGCARILKGKGPAAASVHAQLCRMRRELGPDELPLPGACAHESVWPSGQTMKASDQMANGTLSEARAL